MDFSIERYHGNSLVLPVALTTPQVSESGAITYVPLSIAGAAIRFKLGEITELSDGYSITRNDSAGNFTIIISATLMATLVNPSLLLCNRNHVCIGHSRNALRRQINHKG